LVTFSVDPSAFAAEALAKVAEAEVGVIGVPLQDTPTATIAARSTTDACFINFSSPL
jgi:hypothetical protein